MSRIPCSRCAKKFRTESGLRWHLLHIHDCRDVEKLLWEPAPNKLAHIAVMKEILLQGYAKGIGMDLQYVRDLTNKYFPGYGSGPPVQGISLHVPPVKSGELLSPSTLPYLPTMLPSPSHDLSNIDSTPRPEDGRVRECAMR